jgi:hypothetical protein
MRAVLTVHDLRIGGTQTYALTVAEQLQRLGHEAVIHSPEPGPLAELARQRGLPIALTEDELPAEVDALLTQDAMMAYRMAARFPSSPQLFRCPSEMFDLQLPPQLPGVVGALMAVSDRCADRLRALAGGDEVIRLRQPIDTERFAARGPIRSRPRRAVLLGNYLGDVRLEMLREAWEGAGVECIRLRSMLEPEAALADADIVVAKGKAALEGMACSRAVFVYDQFGCDGWVTPTTYPALEADNFAGVATETVASPASLRAALDEYDPAMGTANRDLVTRHHGARRHAYELVDLLRGLAPRTPTPGLPLRELSRLVRVQWATEGRAHMLGVENTALHARLLETEDALARAQTALTEAEDIAEQARQAAKRARQTAEREQSARADAERRETTLRATRRYRAGSAIGRIADRLRGGA